MEGNRVSGFWKQHRVAAVALGVSAFLTAGVVVTDPAQYGYDARGLAINLVFSMTVGFPVVWALLTANAKLARWWRRRHPIPSQGFPSGERGAEVEPFLWSGRSTQSAWAIVAFIAFFVPLSLIVLFDQRPGTPLGDFTLATMLLMLLVLVVASAFAYRRRTVVIDASGIHVERGLRSDVHVRWSELKEIGVAKLPFSEWAAPFTLGELPRMILLRGLDGRVLGFIQPRAEAPKDVAPKIEGALRAHAAAHGVPVREVTTRETMTWRKPKTPMTALQRAP